MSSTTMDRPDKPDILSMLRQLEAKLLDDLQLIQKQIREWEEKHGMAASLPIQPQEFSGLVPHQAVMQYMRKVKKATRQQICESLVAGGLFSGRTVKDPSKSVNQAISTLVSKKELEEPGRDPNARQPNPKSEIILSESP